MKKLHLFFVAMALVPFEAVAGYNVDQCAYKLERAAEAMYPDPNGGSLVVADGIEMVSAGDHRITYDVPLSRKVGGCGAGFVRFLTDEDCQIVSSSN